MAGSKKRIGNPARKARRASSFKRGEDRKQERIKSQKAAEKRNKELRANGELTPYQARMEAHRAKRAEMLATGQIKQQPRNERGFIIETDAQGHTVLRDPGDWHKRRKVRFSAIANGLISATANGDSSNAERAKVRKFRKSAEV